MDISRPGWSCNVRQSVASASAACARVLRGRHGGPACMLPAHRTVAQLHDTFFAAAGRWAPGAGRRHARRARSGYRHNTARRCRLSSRCALLARCLKQRAACRPLLAVGASARNRPPGSRPPANPSRFASRWLVLLARGTAAARDARHGRHRPDGLGLWPSCSCSPGAPCAPSHVAAAQARSILATSAPWWPVAGGRWVLPAQARLCTAEPQSHIAAWPFETRPS